MNKIKNFNSRGVSIKFIFFFILIILLACIKGTFINPSPKNILNLLKEPSMPFELSPERGRFALTYSIVENKSVFFTNDIAKYVMPDIGYYRGKLVSIFPPGVSIIAIPFYIIGKKIGLSQLLTFSTTTFVSFLNTFLIYKIVKKLTGISNIGIISAVIFIFGTTAFSYSTTLYQHHFVALFLLLGTYFLLLDSFVSVLGVMTLTGILFFIEYQAAIFYLPFLLMLILKNIHFKRTNYDKLIISINRVLFYGFIFIIISFLPFFIYNRITYGNYFQLAGTVQGTEGVREDPLTGNLIFPKINKLKSATGFFHIYNLPRGMSVLLTSKDRGIIYYSPVILFSLLGLFALYKEKKYIFYSVTLSSIAIVFLYAMWGDPWGGWAFGTRYLIPAYALLSIPLGMAIKKYGKNIYFIIPFILVSIYSIFINLSGALTTNQLPPSVEADASRFPNLMFMENIKMVFEGKSSSFIYNAYLSGVDFRIFFFLILFLIISILSGSYFRYLTSGENEI